MTISILSDFNESPGPRYCKQGKASGEEFYHKILNSKFADAIKSKQKLQLNLDGTDGYMSSFWDEAIGNLVFDFSSQKVNEYLEIISKEEPVWKELIFKSIIPEWEERRIKNDTPKKTSQNDHKAWFRLVNGQLEQKLWISSSVV